MSQTVLLVGDSESNANLYYKTHFLAGDPFIYVESGAGSLLVVSPMEIGRARKESSAAEVRSFNDFGYGDFLTELGDADRALAATAARVVSERDGRAGVTVEGVLPVVVADDLRARGLQVNVQTQLFGGERRRKSAEEIAAIEAAQRATERAVRHGIDILAESDIAGDSLLFRGIPLTAERLRAEIELALAREGMDPGQPIVAPGPRAADPHWLGAGPIRPGDAIVMDIFPRSRSTRYFADMTRTVVKGEPRAELVAMYEAVQRALEAALAEVRPGANGQAVHQAAVDALQAAGFHGETGPRMIHSTGHGVGLEIHEAPPLGRTPVELVEGDVITVEPGLYDPEIGGIRLEDLVVVTEGGYRDLTDFPLQFRV